MELRRLAVCVAFLLVARIQCSDARHSLRHLQAYDDYEDSTNQLADEPGDDEAQNDTDNEDPSPKMIVKQPAVILTAPTNYEIQVGGDIELACDVSPNGTVITWSRNNVQYFFGKIPLHPEETRYSIDPNTKGLVIKNVKVSDSGTFKCEALQRTSVAINHTLLVTEMPSVSMSVLNNGIVDEGQELKIDCIVTGSPVPVLMWSLTREGFPNQRLSEKDADFHVNGNTHTMHINSVKKEQAGTYYCYAINKLGNHQAETKVIVNAKPQVHIKKEVVNSDLKIEAVLECAAHEEPKPHIHWYKGGRLIEDSEANYKISTHGAHSNLTVSPANDDDFGTFTCEAENKYGKHNRSIELVQSPVIDDIEVDGSKLSWVVHSHQPLEEMEVQLRSLSQEGDSEWRRLAVPLPEIQRHKYEISYLLEDKQLQAGDYEAIVKVKNSKSWGGSNEPRVVKIEEVQSVQHIQRASVYRGNSAHSIRPADIVLSTILMYFLVRLL